MLFMKLDDAKKGLLFKMLGSKSLYETGIAFGFDKHYKDANAVNGAVYRIYQQVKQDPERYMIPADTMEVIVANVSNRNASKTEGTLREKTDVLEKQDVKELVLTNKKKAMQLLGRKLDLIGSSKKRLDEVNLSSLAQTAGILFDKGQIVQGEATEHVALLAKIDEKMSPELAINAVLKMREVNNIEKEKAKSK